MIGIQAQCGTQSVWITTTVYDSLHGRTNNLCSATAILTTCSKVRLF